MSEVLLSMYIEVQVPVATGGLVGLALTVHFTLDVAACTPRPNGHEAVTRWPRGGHEVVTRRSRGGLSWTGGSSQDDPAPDRYRGTSLIKNRLPLGPHSRPVPSKVVLGGWGGVFL